MRITVTLDEGLYARIVDQADREDRPVSRVVREILTRHYHPHPAGKALGLVPT